jgi:hypothetical protein
VIARGAASPGMADSLLEVAWNRSVLRSRVAPQVEKDLVRVTPAPALRRVISLDDQMMSRPIVARRVAARRLIAATHMSAGAADSQMNPGAAGLEAFLAAARARGDFLDGVEMRAFVTHDGALDVWMPIPSSGG